MTEPTAGLFDRIEQAPNLTAGLINSLVAQIELGQLVPGQRLPTEQAIVAATGVSRTVVREALASLRARGLITTRQGLGAFVCAGTLAHNFSIESGGSIAAILEVLELRLGIETEAASLAASRRSAEEVRRLHEAADAVSAAVQAGLSGADEDVVFHRTILSATRNPHYMRVFNVIGGAVLPRQQVRMDGLVQRDRVTYMRRLHREHAAIASAIEAADPDAARRAMRRHLSLARDRLAALAG